GTTGANSPCRVRLERPARPARLLQPRVRLAARRRLRPRRAVPRPHPGSQVQPVSRESHRRGTPQRLWRCVRADSAAGAPHRHWHRHLGGTDRALPRARRRSALRRLRPARAAHPHARWVSDAADARLPRSECDPRSPARVRRRAGGPATTSGKQTSAQLAFVEPGWRLGAAVNYNGAAAEGSRRAAGVFGGLKTGPVVWLGEADLIDDRSLGNGGVKMLATLAEGDWPIARGHNLKITAEYLDPNRRVPHDQQTRWSLLYELTPVQFVQLRAGVRYSDGIPQLASEHTRLYFLELHGFF